MAQDPDDGSAADAGPLLAALRLTGLTSRTAWLRYLALGGNLDEVSVEAHLHGVLEIPAGEYNVLAHALNEELDDLPEADRVPRVPYRRSVGESLLRREG
ncbi:MULTISPECIES: hypothetical protein [unclassified Blastococcus]